MATNNITEKNNIPQNINNNNTKKPLSSIEIRAEKSGIPSKKISAIRKKGGFIQNIKTHEKINTKLKQEITKSIINKCYPLFKMLDLDENTINGLKEVINNTKISPYKKPNDMMTQSVLQMGKVLKDTGIDMDEFYETAIKSAKASFSNVIAISKKDDDEKQLNRKKRKNTIDDVKNQQENLEKDKKKKLQQKKKGRKFNEILKNLTKPSRTSYTPKGMTYENENEKNIKRKIIEEQQKKSVKIKTSNPVNGPANETEENKVQQAFGEIKKECLNEAMLAYKEMCKKLTMSKNKVSKIKALLLNTYGFVLFNTKQTSSSQGNPTGVKKDRPATTNTPHGPLLQHKITDVYIHLTTFQDGKLPNNSIKKTTTSLFRHCYLSELLNKYYNPSINNKARDLLLTEINKNKQLNKKESLVLK